MGPGCGWGLVLQIASYGLVGVQHHALQLRCVFVHVVTV
jgi:hypothetical protein